MYVCVDPRLCVYFLAHGDILVHVCFDVQTGVCLETKKCVCVCVCRSDRGMEGATGLYEVRVLRRECFVFMER